MSVRHNFENVSDSIHHEMLGYNGKTLTQGSTTIDGFLTRQRNDKLSTETNVLFLELHGKTHSVLQLYTQLQRWRRLAAAHDTGFFVYTLVREPVSFTVSNFNFFWAAPCLFSGGCPYKLYRATVDNLLFTAKPNVQCLYYSRSDVTWRLFKDHHDGSDPFQVAYPTATEAECLAVQQVLLDEMDWVGTTDRLSQETLPLLAYMLSSGTAAPVNLQETESGVLVEQVMIEEKKDDDDDDDDSTKHKKKKKKGAADSNWQVFNSVAAQKEGVITMDSLKPADVDYIRSMNTYDQAIYDAVAAEFTMDMWEDWIAE
jgi:hypothetical protein